MTFRRLGLLMEAILLSLSVPVFAQSEVEMGEPNAGSWPTWLLVSGDQLRLDTPPDEATTAEEIAQLMEMANERDETALEQITYWNAGPPSYRWNQIAVGAIDKRVIPSENSSRALALVHTAVYDATIAAWDSKYIYNRPRPSNVNPTLTTAILNPSSPSYPSEYAVTAGAASTVLAWLFPDDAEFFEAQAQEAVNSRLLAGVEYTGDVEAGLELGRQVAELAMCPPIRPAGREKIRSRRSPATGQTGHYLRPTSSCLRHRPPTIRSNWLPKWRSYATLNAPPLVTLKPCTGSSAEVLVSTTRTGTTQRAV